MKLLKRLTAWIRVFYRHRWLLITLVLAALLIRFWLPRFQHAYRQYNAHQTENKRLEKTIANTRTECRQKQHFVQKTQKDPAFREHVLREQLGVVKEGDTVVRFYPADAEKQRNVKF